MAILSDLVAALANLTGVPEATIFAYGRFARENGCISQKGRGRAAANMDLKDAANLLIAVGGTAITREAGEAIRTYRPMRGKVLVNFKQLSEMFYEWLKPLNLQHDFVGTEMNPVVYSPNQHSDLGGGFEVTFWGNRNVNSAPNRGADFGAFLEFLLGEAVSGSLMEVMQKIPSPTPKGSLKFGRDMGIAIRFDRSFPKVTVEFNIYQLGSPVTVAAASFRPARHSKSLGYALDVSATLTQNALFGLGLVAMDKVLPEALKSPHHELHQVYHSQATRCAPEPASIAPILARPIRGAEE